MNPSSHHLPSSDSPTKTSQDIGVGGWVKEKWESDIDTALNRGGGRARPEGQAAPPAPVVRRCTESEGLAPSLPR